MKVTSKNHNFKTSSKVFLFNMKEKLSFTRNNKLEKILSSLKDDPVEQPSDISNLYLFEKNIFDKAVQDTKKL